jgi:GTPase
MFVDTASVRVKAGDGGDGAVSFRRERYIDRGGPDGGDGGRGGHIIFRADENLNTLVKFRHNQEIKAANGEAGRKQRQHGKNGEDTVVPIPVGTVVMYDGNMVADLTQHEQQVVIAQGGDGGFGNAHFKSSTRQTPRVAELGEKGESFELKLELKLLADVGLVGFPNAGKSTFLSVVTAAKPEIADYAFTTLTPNLGVADFDEHSLLIADIPGLIEGASEGKGLGDAFLRHVERTAVLLHLIDVYEEDVAGAYKTISEELKAHSGDLAKRPRIVVLTKVEGLEPELIREQEKALKKVVVKGTKVMAISSTAHIGTIEVLREAYELVAKVRQAEKAVEKETSDEVPVIELDEAAREAAWHVREEEGRFIVTGAKIEKFAARTDFSNEFGVARLRDIMRKMGITHEIIRKGAKPDDVIVIGESGEHHLRLQ